MAENLKLSSPVEIKDNSKERVAFDLMQQIADAETRGFTSFDQIYTDQKSRVYWLRLYSQCLKIVNATSWTAEEAIKQSTPDAEQD